MWTTITAILFWFFALGLVLAVMGMIYPFKPFKSRKEALRLASGNGIHLNRAAKLSNNVGPPQPTGIKASFSMACEPFRLPIVQVLCKHFHGSAEAAKHRVEYCPAMCLT